MARKRTTEDRLHTLEERVELIADRLMQGIGLNVHFETEPEVDAGLAGEPGTPDNLKQLDASGKALEGDEADEALAEQIAQNEEIVAEQAKDSAVQQEEADRVTAQREEAEKARTAAARRASRR